MGSDFPLQIGVCCIVLMFSGLELICEVCMNDFLHLVFHSGCRTVLGKWFTSFGGGFCCATLVPGWQCQFTDGTMLPSSTLSNGTF